MHPIFLQIFVNSHPSAIAGPTRNTNWWPCQPIGLPISVLYGCYGAIAIATVLGDRFFHFEVPKTFYSYII
jgi:hypothetical protein